MLQLKNITKHYYVADQTIEALKGVSLSFRESEFVSVLGPSGCGKTTLLNIIGGLDRYTSGDIVINGVSTKLYDDRDWDAYRNHSIGFVFQSYNLIPHQTVLANVELALTLSGVSKQESKKAAENALEKVGLKDHINKLPGQLSGGQMQRVAIARAIVNNPDIILADEPTGALDTETSIQIMNILKEIAVDRLVIMVTHNPELARQYSTRIIKLKDGSVREDSDPFEYTVAEKSKAQENALKEKRYAGLKNAKKPSMGFLTALTLSLRNLGTKKARTVLTSFAGSIGIIGIALILSLSAGFNGYIANVQKDTLSNYPVTVNSTSMDMNSYMTSFMGASGADTETGKYPDSDIITSNKMIGNMLDSMSDSYGANDLKSFKKYLEDNNLVSGNDKISAVKFGYDFELNLYEKQDAAYKKVNEVAPIENYMPDESMIEWFRVPYEYFKNMMSTSGTWGEMINSTTLLKSQYDLLGGEWPSLDNPADGESFPLLIVVDEYNRIPDYSLYMMGLMSDDDVRYMFAELAYKLRYKDDYKQKLDEAYPDYKPGISEFKLADLVGKKYNVLLDSEYFGLDSAYSPIVGEDNIVYRRYKDMSDSDEFVNTALASSVPLKVCGVIRQKEGVAAAALGRNIYYTAALTKYLIQKTASVPVIKDQLSYVGTQSEGNASWNCLTGEIVSNSAVLEMGLGFVDEDLPSSVSLFPTSFENKDYVVKIIDDYNAAQTDESKKLQYSDYIGMMMSSITTIINAITYVLIAFVSISLVVSSIMIGVITYISVLERTKEIGILRSIGASKRDIGRVFNAETIIIGFISGMLGILITVLLDIPISLIIKLLAGIPDVASLPPIGGLVLVVISVLLTLIAGLIPARMASKRDPVVALRSE